MKLKVGMVVHCDTEEKAIEFLKESHKQGWKWISGRKIINKNGKVHINYNDYESNTVYYLESLGLSYGQLSNSPKDKVISFDDLLKTTEKKECKIYTKHEYIHDNVKKVIVNEPCVIVILKTGEKGISKCHPEDVFNEELGYKIAYQRTQIQRAKLNLRMQELRLEYLIKGLL